MKVVDSDGNIYPDNRRPLIYSNSSNNFLIQEKFDPTHNITFLGFCAEVMEFRIELEGVDSASITMPVSHVIPNLCLIQKVTQPTYRLFVGSPFLLSIGNNGNTIPLKAVTPTILNGVDVSADFSYINKEENSKLF